MGGLRHTVVERWAQRPSGYTHRGVVGVAVDSRERAFILTRGEARVIIYERDGSFVGSWGEGRFTERTHGLTIAPDNSVFVVDEGREVVYKFTPDGELLLTLGTPGGASDTGYDGRSLESIARGGPPFHHPTNIAFDRARRVHGVSPDDRPDRWPSSTWRAACWRAGADLIAAHRGTSSRRTTSAVGTTTSVRVR